MAEQAAIPGTTPTEEPAPVSVVDLPISKKAQARLKVKSPLFEKLGAIIGDLYSKENNPGGIVPMALAENSLMYTELDQYFRKKLALGPFEFSYGDSFKGSSRLFSAFSHIFSKYFRPLEPVKAEHIVTGVGASPILDTLAEIICDAGQGVMLATPYYNGFELDLSGRSNAVPIPVDIAGYDPGSPSVIEAYEKVIQEHEAEGKPEIKAFILCNPHNPLGFCYSKEAILAHLEFAEKHNLHIIVDEIYALTIYKNRDFPTTPQDFVSVLSIDVEKEADCNPNRVHLIYGASKDFAINGFRIGCLVTKNPQVLQAYTPSAVFMKVSSPADQLWSSLVLNDKMLDWFVNENQKRLSVAYNHTIDFLNKYDIKYRPAYAGQFILIDLSPLLPENDPEGKPYKTDQEKEMALWDQTLDAKVWINPGLFYQHPQPGWFRLTFSIEQSIAKVGLQRLGSVIDKIRGTSTGGPTSEGSRCEVV